MIILKYSLAIFCLLLTGCSFFSSHKEKESTPLMEYEQTTEDIQPREECSTVSPPERSEMALYMDSLGLVNIADLDSSLVVKLMYTQADNFTGEVLYDNLTEAYLHPDAAYALIEAQKALKKSRRNGKCIQNQSKKFSAFQVCKTLITDRPFSVNLEFIAL